MVYNEYEVAVIPTETQGEFTLARAGSKVHIVMDLFDDTALCGKPMGDFDVKTFDQYPFDNCCKNCLLYVENRGVHEMSTKKCPYCGMTKLAGQFNKDKNRPDGFQIYCKECSNQLGYIRRQENAARLESELPPLLICAECKEEKPNSEFYRTIGMSSGFSDKCKSCIKRIRSQYWSDDDDVHEILGKTTTKQCPKCGEVKSVTDYHVDRSNKNGLTPRCKQCVNKEGDERRKMNAAKGKSKVPSRKVCSVCNTEKPSNEFHANRGANDGLDGRCKVCASELKKQYNQDNPHIMLNASVRRRVLLEEQRGIVTPEKVNEIYNAEYCYYCGIGFNDSFKPEIEHYIPLALGGMHDDSNLVPSCGPCNDSKGSKHPDEFLEWLSEYI